MCVCVTIIVHVKYVTDDKINTAKPLCCFQIIQGEKR